jgi:SOS-response transcriptional repressor LexA
LPKFTGDPEVGARLRTLRDARGFTLENVVEQLPGLSIASLSRYETGKQWIPPDELRRLAKFYGIEVGDLWSDSAVSRERLGVSAEGLIRAGLAMLEGRASGVVERITPLRVPLIRTAASIGSVRTFADGEDVLYQPQPDQSGHEFVAVEVRGDCLEPSGILSGHRAIVNLTIKDQARHRSLVLARDGDGELMVKRLTIDGNSRWLVADQHWVPLPVGDGVEVLGVCMDFFYRPPR